MRFARRAIISLAVVLLLLLQSCILVSASAMSPSEAPSLALISHAPIHIDNDADLLAQAAAEGWPGSGTSGDPITITDLDISSGAWPASFYIQRTSLHLVISDSLIASTAINGNATSMLEVSHVTFRNSTISGYVALIGFSCQDIVVANCTLRGSTRPGTLGEPSPIFFDTVSDIKVTGTRLEQDGFTRSYFHAGERVLIENSTVIASSLTIISCQNTRVADNTFLESETFGLYLLGSSGTTIARNLFRNGSTGLFIYEGGGLETRNIFLKGNRFENVGVNFEGSDLTLATTTSQDDLVNGKPLMILKDLDLHGGGLPASGNEYLLLRVRNGTISDLSIQGGNAALFLSDCQRLTISNCTFTDIMGYGVGLTKTVDVNLRGCVFIRVNMAIFSLVNTLEERNVRTVIMQCQFQACIEAITDTAGLDFIIADNAFTGPGTFGITISSVTGTIIVGNVFSDLSGEAVALSTIAPIVVESSKGVRITGNTILRCRGITLVGIMDSLVDNNSIRHSSTTGIALVALVNNVSLTRNQIEHCTGYGIIVKRAEEPNLDNTIFSNILVGNNGAGRTYDPSHIQASDDARYRTQWSVAGASGRQGNYWSDLTEPDVNHTGFVDIPYAIADRVADARPFASILPFQATSVIGAFANEKVELAWAAPSFPGISPLTGYLVEKKVNDGAWTVVAMVNSTTYMDSNVSRGNDYQYSISAVNELGVGNGSIPITVSVRLHDWSLLYLILAVIVIVGVWSLVILIGKK